jgi:hypothetical protein
MATITVFNESAWGDVVVEPVERYMLTRQWGNSADPIMRRFLEAIVGGILRYRPRYAISDLSRATGQTSFADAEWLKGQIPQTAAAGCIYQLIIPPAGAFTKLTVDSVAGVEEQHGVNTVTVASLADALAYVQNERRLTAT